MTMPAAGQHEDIHECGDAIDKPRNVSVVKVAEQKEAHADKKAAKAERDASGRGRFPRGHDDDAEEASPSAPREGELDA